MKPARAAVVGGACTGMGVKNNTIIHFAESSKKTYSSLQTLPCSPTLGGQAVTFLEARRIVLKMLAVLSSHSKMQVELAKEPSLKLLIGACKDNSLENVTNALITLANVAQNINSHGLVCMYDVIIMSSYLLSYLHYIIITSSLQLLQLGIVETLLFYLNKGPRPRYHAARALVYLGKLDKLNQISLFEPMATGRSIRLEGVLSCDLHVICHVTGYETDVVIMSTDIDGHSYARYVRLYRRWLEFLNYGNFFEFVSCTRVHEHFICRGATIEKCVEILTGDLSALWGGFNLSMGVQSPSEDTIAPMATKDQILDFFLTTYQSFVKPLVLMRLLLHRLATTGSKNPFDWSVEAEKSVVATTTHSTSIPPTQANVLKLIGQWMESYPNDFIEHPALQGEVLKVIQRLKLARGPYLPHAHRLKSFLQDASHPRISSSLASAEEERRVPHHDNLYKLVRIVFHQVVYDVIIMSYLVLQCKQMVLGGHLPVTMDTAVFLASLQLHIEVSL